MTFSSLLFPATPAPWYLSLSLPLSGFLVPCALLLLFPEGLFPPLRVSFPLSQSIYPTYINTQKHEKLGPNDFLSGVTMLGNQAVEKHLEGYSRH